MKYGEQSGTGAGFSPVIRDSPVSINHCLLYTRRHLHVSLSIRTNEPSLGPFRKKATVFGNLEPLGVKVPSLLPVLRMLIAEVFFAVPSAFLQVYTLPYL